MAVAASGAELIGAIKAEASWSKRIGSATSIAASFGASKASIRIRTDHKAAPHARPLELGNATTFSASVIEAHGGFKVGADGKRRASNTSIYAAMRKTGVGVGRELRHPVFGKGITSQPLRPYFFSAIEAKSPGIDRKFQAAIDQVAKDAGFN